MVRGNWQRRVEKAEARRTVAKQRKQKKCNRASFKGMVAALLTALDKHRVSSSSTSVNTLHVWTDVTPSGYAPPILDPHVKEKNDSGCQKQRRGRSGSFHETPSKPRKPFDSKKKAHPRSRDVVDPVEQEGITFDAPRLCRSQFYGGRCGDMKQGGKKSAGCPHVHFVKKQQKTLADVLDSKNHADVLISAETAMVESTIDDVEEASKGMEMLYYFTVELIASGVNDQAAGGSVSVGQLLSQALSDKACNNASLVYIAMEETLIFDRYQGGLVIPDESQLFGDGRRPRSASIMSEASETDGADAESAESVPAPVLEHILTFLSDIAVGTMMRVCTSWKNEIGTTSPALWRHLLHRRNWPLPVSPSSLEEITLDEMRGSFTRHYQVVRDVTAIKEALSALAISRRGPPDEIEMVYQLFSTRRKAPTEPNACVAMEVWSPNKIIAAYSHDCTIRLFKAVEKSAAEKGERACRELISVCVDPYRKTKKHTARLVAMGLDDDKIGCLLHVQGGIRSDNSILSIVSRDDYLEAAGSDTSDSLGWSELEEGVLNVIDIGEAIVNFLLSANEVDHRMLHLVDFLADGGGMEDIEVLVSQSVVACGYGRFLVEATVSIPDFDTSDNEDHDEHDAMITLGRKLVIFSSTIGAIIWMGDSNPTQNAIPRHHDLILSGIRHGIDGSRLACSLVAVSSTSPTILLLDIDLTGQVYSIHPIETAEIVRAEILSTEEGAGWVLEMDRRRPVALLQTEVVAVDVLSKERGDNSRDYKSILSFYSRFSDHDDEISYETVALNCNILSMEQIRDQHVVLVCEEIGQDSSSTAATAMDGGGAAVATDTIDGQWFAEEPVERVVSLNAVIFHVPSRQIIHRTHHLLSNDVHLHDALLQGTTSLVVTASLGDTIGVGVWWKGIIMTGNDVRAVGNGIGGRGIDESTAPSKDGGGRTKKKKKKARQINKGGKKDAFARGMSMRG